MFITYLPSQSSLESHPIGLRVPSTNVVLALEHMGLGALIISLYDLNGVYEQSPHPY
jgi:nitroreductase